jgi:hypothetical protein
MSVVCPHPLDTLGALESGRIMLEGQMGLYEYARYIRTVTEGRSIVFQCDKGNAVLGETLLFVAEFCRHPSRTAIGRLRNGTIKLESFMGAFDYSDYVRFVGDSRRIVYECRHPYCYSCRTSKGHLRQRSVETERRAQVCLADASAGRRSHRVGQNEANSVICFDFCRYCRFFSGGTSCCW